jgi:hypothetical protein
MLLLPLVALALLHPPLASNQAEDNNLRSAAKGGNDHPPRRQAVQRQALL